jgi:predicted CoA-binding protein
MTMNKTNAGEAFLTHRRLAVVGVSRDPRDFSRTVVAELSRRGYDVVPVNPANQLGGGRSASGAFIRRLQDIVPPVEAALLMTPPAVTSEVVKDCAEAGIRHVWMHQGVGRGAASPAAIAFCESHGISVVSGACPLMYLPETGFVHRAHRWCREVLRSPRAGGTATASAFRP